jgi:hypothetical protein
MKDLRHRSNREDQSNQEFTCTLLWFYIPGIVSAHAILSFFIAVSESSQGGTTQKPVYFHKGGEGGAQSAWTDGGFLLLF